MHLSCRTTVTLGGPGRQPRSTLQDSSAAGSALNSTAGTQLVDYSLLGSTAASDGSLKKPDFRVLTELTQQAPGEANPVTDWHNDFVKVGTRAAWQLIHLRIFDCWDWATAALLRRRLLSLSLNCCSSSSSDSVIPSSTSRLLNSPVARPSRSLDKYLLKLTHEIIL